MKKTLLIALAFTAGEDFSQIQRQQPLPQLYNIRANSTNNDLNMQVQSFNPTFASNISLNNSTKVNTVRANPSMVNTNKDNIKTVQQKKVIPQVKTQQRRINVQQPLPQINIQNLINIANVPLQNNLGNKSIEINNVDLQVLENVNYIQVQAAAPQIQSGSGNGNNDGNSFSLHINLPKINLPTLNIKPMKFSSGENSHSYHKKLHLKNKWIKLNRKMSGKLSFGRKLRIKVDNCFKW